MEKKKLSEVTLVTTGYTFRSSIVLASDGCSLIQLKDINADGTVSIDNTYKTDCKDFKETHCLQTGDIVFRSRGNLFTAGVVPVLQVPCVLAAPLIRIRLKTTAILSAYIAWFINSSTGQAALKSEVCGSSIRMISKASLDALEIPVPQLEMQMKIAEVSQLLSRERELALHILKKKEQLVNRTIEQLITADN